MQTILVDKAKVVKKMESYTTTPPSQKKLRKSMFTDDGKYINFSSRNTPSEKENIASLSRIEPQMDEILPSRRDFSRRDVNADVCPLLPPDTHEFTPDMDLLRKYFEYLGTASFSHIDSFNQFVKVYIRELLRSRVVKTVDSTTGDVLYSRFDYPIISRPIYTAGAASYKMYPARAMEKHETYEFTVHARVVTFKIIIDPKTGNRVEHIVAEEAEARPIARIPAMLGSCVCHLEKITDPVRLLKLGEDPHDPYGYFIINGTKKALITTEKLLLDKIYVLPPAAARADKDSAYARITVPTAVGTKQMQVVLDKDGAVCLQIAAFRRLADNKTPRIINVLHIIDIIDHYLMTDAEGKYDSMYKRSRSMASSQSELMKEVGIVPIFREMLLQFVAPEEWLGVSNELVATEASYATVLSGSAVTEINMGDYEAVNFEHQQEEIKINEKYDAGRQEWMNWVQKTVHDENRLGTLTEAKVSNIRKEYETAIKRIEDSRAKELQTITRTRDAQIASLNALAGDDRRILKPMVELMTGIGVTSTSEWQQKLLDIFSEEFFPNIHRSRMYEKIIMLTILVAELLRYGAGYRKVDDKNSWANKRIDMPGIEVAKILRGAWSKMFEKAQASVNKNSKTQFQAIVNAFDLNLITKDMEAAFTSSCFGLKGGFARTSLTEILETHNLVSTYSMLNKIDVKMDRNSSSPKVRAVQPTQQRYVCPAQTTDDSACGIVKNKACACKVTIQRDPNIIYVYLKSLGIIKDEKCKEYPDYLVINGYMRGWTSRSVMKEAFIKGRRTGPIYKDSEILADRKGKVEIFTNAGRLVVPMLYVNPDTGMPALYDHKGDYTALTFDEMLRYGYVGYLGAAEAEYVNTAYNDDILRARLNTIASYERQIQSLNEDLMMASHDEEENEIKKNITSVEFALKKERIPYHYRDLHPIVMLGIAGALTVYGNRMHGCRLTYQTKMSKQAMTMPPQNPKLYEGAQKRMLYPTRPLIQSGLESIFGITNRPLGQNINLLIGSISGFNQEDAIVVSKRAIDMGLFRYIKTFVKETRLNSISGYTHLLKKPTPHPNEDTSIYEYLEEDGLPMIGAVLQQNDCVIGRIQQSLTNADDVINASIFMGIGEYGIVDSVKVVEDSKGTYIAVRLHAVKSAAVGDKFAPRYAQKATIGIVRAPEDMPITTDGIVPDVIMNPHAIPSRMTMGLLAEMLVGTAAGLIGRVIDATSFQEYNEKIFMSILSKYGILPTGEKVFYDGVTGQKIQHTMFSGNVFYQQLLHIAGDKIQARGRGKVSDITKQPLKGKSRGGGMQTGAMEFRAFLEHGAVNIMKNRSCDHSDAYTVAYCMGESAGEKCGAFATLDRKYDLTTNTEKMYYRCPRCNSNKFGRTVIPYVFKYLIQLLVTYNINLYSILVEEQDYPDILEARARTGDTSLNRKRARGSIGAQIGLSGEQISQMYTGEGEIVDYEEYQQDVMEDIGRYDEPVMFEDEEGLDDNEEF